MRSKRRHHKERMKRKAKRIAGIIWGYLSSPFRREDIVENMIKNADHLKSCSCDKCCNPRRSGWNKKKRTRQEEKFYDSLDD